MLKAAGITSQFDSTLISATSSMFSFACSITFSFLPARVGRRRLLLWSMFGMFLVFSSITICTAIFKETGNVHAGYGAVAFIYVYNGVHNLGMVGAVIVFVTEIVPFYQRGKAIALFHLSGGLAQTFATYITPVGIAGVGWRFYLFFVC